MMIARAVQTTLHIPLHFAARPPTPYFLFSLKFIQAPCENDTPTFVVGVQEKVLPES